MNTQNEIVIYQMPNGEMQLDVTVSGETIWLTQRQIAELFGTKVPAISKHLKNIFASGELIEEGGVSKCAPPSFYAQSPDFHKLGLCYYLKILYL